MAENPAPLPPIPSLNGAENSIRRSEAYRGAMDDPVLALLEPDRTRRDRLVCAVLNAASIPAPCASIHLFEQQPGVLGVVMELDPPVDTDAGPGDVPMPHLAAGRMVDWLGQQLHRPAGE
jgi:hypothetical protein